MLKGYNDLNTNIPNTFATDEKIVLSGAGRKAVVYEGAGFLDEVKKTNNKGKSVVGSLKEDKDVIKEFNKAKQFRLSGRS